MINLEAFSDQSKRTSLTACLLYDVLTLVP